MKLVTQWIACAALAAALLAPATAPARAPEGWPFLEFNAAVQVAKRQGKPMFVYFGFYTCPYCVYLNDHTLSFDSLRERYTKNYVLAYFDIRANPNDEIVLPGGEKVRRGDAIKMLKGSPVPAWMFVAPDGRTVLMRRGSRTPVGAFIKYDLYVAGGEYRQGTFEEFLVRHGMTEDGAE